MISWRMSCNLVEVLEAVGHLSHDEQEELIGILHRRLAQASRHRLVAEIKESRQEFDPRDQAPAW